MSPKLWSPKRAPGAGLGAAGSGKMRSGNLSWFAGVGVAAGWKEWGCGAGRCGAGLGWLGRVQLGWGWGWRGRNVRGFGRPGSGAGSSAPDGGSRSLGRENFGGRSLDSGSLESRNLGSRNPGWRNPGRATVIILARERLRLRIARSALGITYRSGLRGPLPRITAKILPRLRRPGLRVRQGRALRGCRWASWRRPAPGRLRKSSVVPLPAEPACLIPSS